MFNIYLNMFNIFKNISAVQVILEVIMYFITVVVSFIVQVNPRISNGGFQGKYERTLYWRHPNQTSTDI